MGHQMGQIQLSDWLLKEAAVPSQGPLEVGLSQTKTFKHIIKNWAWTRIDDTFAFKFM